MTAGNGGFLSKTCMADADSEVGRQLLGHPP